MQVSSIMVKRVVAVRMDDSLRQIAEIFDNTKFHHLLVVENNRLYGVISDRDLLKASSPFLNSFSEELRDSAILNKRVHQIMSRKPIVITPEASLAEAVSLLLQENVSCLGVVSADGQIEGIVTWKDLLKAYAREK